ncbi:MAG: DUF1844 domain-containing protein [Thermodesulfobacteriota bacterium]
MSEEDKGFTVKDRRRFDEKGDVRPESEEAAPAEKAPARESRPQPPEPQGEAPAPERPPRGQQPRGARPPLPPVDFSGLILSLAHATMLHLGHMPDAMGRPGQPDLELARHTIDTIAMLKEKTKGNLDEQEQKLINTALTELQMAFVQASKG